MATRTTYLNLIKPDYSDAADIADINANMDTLDDKIKGIDSAAIDDTLVPTSDSGTIRNQLSQLANRIKAATGAGGWKDDPSTTLASLATLVSNLSTGSDVTWDGKKFTNTKLGISGLMDENGYVSFGKNFGGLIIQWGSFYNANGLSAFTYPLALSSKPYEIITTEGDPAGWNAGNGIVVSGADITTASNTQANILSKWVNNGGNVKQGGATVRVLIIGH
ncbi:gp53-like domain-containing protein [Acidaminococcus intestini]|uniref:gp53-like domain-containing protein n=2 Tax=Negativicutes TaxID=909932 RepID=UPI00307BA848